MKVDLDDFNFQEQANIMNILNNYNGNNQMKNKQSIGFNTEALYNFIEPNKDK